MNGHEKIIEMRMAGERPLCVFVDDFKVQKSKWAQDDDFLNVCIEGDSIKTLDLTFLHGLDVRATLNTEKRARDFVDACKQVQVKTIAAYVPDGRGSGLMIIEGVT